MSTTGRAGGYDGRGRRASAARGWVLPVACCLLGLACGGAQPARDDAEDPCVDVELDVRRVWSAEVRAEVLGYGGQVGATTREEIATTMDRVTEDWARLRRSVCLDHFRRHVISAEEYRTRTVCLDRTLQRQRSLVEALRSENVPESTVADLADLSGGVGDCGTP